MIRLPIPVPALSNAQVNDRRLVGIAGSIPAGDI